MAPKKEETKKRKAEDKPEDEPAAKKEVSNDVEKDDKADSRPVTKATVGWNGADTTLNVVAAMDGKVLTAITEGGMQYLIAGARASLGMKAGRYMYEVRIIEALNPVESTQSSHGRTPQPRQLVRLGFSTSGSSLVLGDDADCVYFDSEGNFGSGKVKRKCAQNFSRDKVVGVLLNLDPSSPNANTVSLFSEGVRIAAPQPIPENLHGETLFPHISFRNVTIQVNMGKTLLKELPFKTRMIQGAAAPDVVESKSGLGKDGKCEVMLPVAMPDEGTFDWLDDFLKANPSYVELSDRKLQEWATSSGLVKPKAVGSSNDKPAFNYNIPSMDDGSLRRLVNSVAATVPRNYVVMEVKSNLVAEDRADILKRFSWGKFRRTAMVVMGEPSADFKEKSQERLLQEKQTRADNEWKVKKAQKEQQKALAKRQKELAEMRKKAEEQRKKMVEEALKKKAEEEAKKKAEEEAKKKAEAAKEAGEAEKEGDNSKMEVEKEEVKEEEKAEVKEEQKEETKEEEAKEEPEEEEDDGLGTEPPKVELTEEEEKVYFRPKVGMGDLTAAVLSKSYASFSIPEKSEGFDEIKFAWDPQGKSKEYLRKWMLETKAVTRIEDLQPSEHFTTKNAAWQKLYAEWQGKQKAFKAKPAAAKKKEESTGDEKKASDIFSIEDVSNMGDGEPLYANFGPEDWALLQIRMEVHLLQEYYKKDVDDPDRIAVPEAHLSFYYTKYFKKTLSPQVFGLKTIKELLELVKDTATISGEPAVLTSHVEDVDSAEIFAKFTEECRRDRKRRGDAGDETAKLKYTPPVLQAVGPVGTSQAVRPATPAVQGQAWAAARPAAVPGVKGAAWPSPAWKGKGW